MLWRLFQLSFPAGLLWMGYGDPTAPGPGMLLFLGLCMSALATGILSRLIDFVRYRLLNPRRDGDADALVIGRAERLSCGESLGDPLPWIDGNGRRPPAP